MKASGVSRGLLEQASVCSRCETTTGVRWVAVVTPYYTFSGYVCKVCEPTMGPPLNKQVV